MISVGSPGIMTRAKGIKVKDIVEGSGRVAEKGKVVLVHFDCRLSRGDLVSSSRAEPAHQMVIGKRRSYIGLEQGVVGMREGGKRQIKVSPNLTYYERIEFPHLPEGAVLRYEVELLRVRDRWDNSVELPRIEHRLRTDGRKTPG
jgi:peptidylprolyl isomerase